MPRSGIGLNDSLGRRTPALRLELRPPNTWAEQYNNPRSWCLRRSEQEQPGARPETLTAPCPKPTRQVESCGGSRVSEAKVLQA